MGDVASVSASSHSIVVSFLFSCVVGSLRVGNAVSGSVRLMDVLLLLLLLAICIIYAGYLHIYYQNKRRNIISEKEELVINFKAYMRQVS